MTQTVSTFRFDLLGKRVIQAEQDTDGIGLQLEGEWNIRIYAKSVVCYGDEIVGAICEVIGAALTQFVGNSASEILSFDNGCKITVDLRSNVGYVVEPMVVYGPERLIIVWE